MKNKKKAAILSLALLFVAPISFASQPEVLSNQGSNDPPVTVSNYDSGIKDFLGGKWRHGVNDTHVWSWFYHSKRFHTTTVKGAGGQYGYSGITNPRETAYASWEKAPSGNEAYANVINWHNVL